MSVELYHLLSIIIQGLATFIAIGSLIFASVQIKQFVDNRQKQYEQLRRSKTVDMVIHYAQNVKKETKTIEKIVLTFSDEQCKKLYNCSPFYVSSRTRDKICDICPYKEECIQITDETNKPCYTKDGEKNLEYSIHGPILRFIREQVISYLNTLESVMLAWQLGIVDRKTIEEQFAFLDKKRPQERALQSFRRIAGGGQSYPAIEHFYEYLETTHRETAKETLKDILS